MEYNENGRYKRKAKNEIDYKPLLSENEGSRAFEAFLKAAVRIHSDDRDDLEIPSTPKYARKVKMQNTMMQCRRIVNHPYLLEYPLDEDGQIKVDEELVKNCGKLQVLDQLLTELKSRGHKVLLFSQMTMLLDIIEDYLFLRPQYKYKRLDGTTKLIDRQSDIEEFNSNPDCFLYLISTRAGSLGINLTAADTCIIYDSDWNPQQDLQAQDRCHRIGQTKPVLVLRLVTAASIDEKIVDRAATKRKLEKMVIKSGKFKSNNISARNVEKIIDLDELRELLKTRDHSRIHKTKTGNIFTKTELNALLDRSDMISDYKSSNKKNPKDKKKLEGVFKTIENVST